MRFQDWDVLLFPYGSHVPIREFRTGCFAQQDGLAATPLMTCFVPSLHDGAPFQISLHSWNKPTSILGPNAGYATGTHYVWRIKIAVDGHVAVADMLPEDVTWPRQIDTASALGPTESLAFPKFHRSVLSQSHWYASDEKGRIKVQLSAGYMVERDGKPQFVKLLDHVTFSFQPAPIDILERSGIAWPNASLPIVNNPLQPPDARQMSVGGLPFPDDGSSRSTSAYSTYSPAAYPPMQVPALSPHPASYAHSLGQEGLKLRLPTDQLQTIINALSPSRPFTNASMPPPPLPQRLTMPPLPLAPVVDRRGDSRFSDISMHAGCTAFPSCLTEDAEGHLVHTTGPATMVKGRKEGSSPTKSRDFMSTVMDAPTASTAPNVSSPTEGSGSGSASASARKRTRSALRSLTLNDGSPEKKEKPPRKVSRPSADSEDKENMMVE